MSGECLFHLTRPDLEAARFDQVLFAVYDKEIAIFVQVAQVAGVDPAVADHGRRFVRALPIAHHDLWRTDADLTKLAGGQGLFAAVNIDDAHLYVGHGDADRAGLILAVYGADDGSQHGFGHAIGVQQHPARQSLEAALGFGQQRRCAGVTHLHRLEIDLVGLDLGVVEQGNKERGHTVKDGGTHFGDGGEQVVDVAWVGHDCHWPAGDERCAQRHVAVDMEHGHHHCDDVIPVGEGRAPVGMELHGRLEQGVVRT